MIALMCSDGRVNAQYVYPWEQPCDTDLSIILTHTWRDQHWKVKSLVLAEPRHVSLMLLQLIHLLCAAALLNLFFSCFVTLSYNETLISTLIDMYKCYSYARFRDLGAYTKREDLRFQKVSILWDMCKWHQGIFKRDEKLHKTWERRNWMIRYCKQR